MRYQKQETEVDIKDVYSSASFYHIHLYSQDTELEILFSPIFSFLRGKIKTVHISMCWLTFVIIFQLSQLEVGNSKKIVSFEGFDIRVQDFYMILNISFMVAMFFPFPLS